VRLVGYTVFLLHTDYNKEATRGGVMQRQEEAALLDAFRLLSPLKRRVYLKQMIEDATREQMKGARKPALRLVASGGLGVVNVLGGEIASHPHNTEPRVAGK
jgi:hypothetical protein